MHWNVWEISDLVLHLTVTSTDLEHKHRIIIPCLASGSHTAVTGSAGWNNLIYLVTMASLGSQSKKYKMWFTTEKLYFSKRQTAHKLKIA